MTPGRDEQANGDQRIDEVELEVRLELLELRAAPAILCFVEWIPNNIK